MSPNGRAVARGTRATSVEASPLRGGWRAAARPVIAIAGLGVLLVVVLTKPVYAIPMLLVPTGVVLAQRCPRDAVTVLTIFVVLLFAIPANLVVGPLGSAGRPALLLGLGCAWWWFHDRLLPDSAVARGFQPVRLTAALLGGGVVASYAAAFARTIDEIEARAADRGVLALAGLLGVVVLAADGIADRERLDTLLRRVVAGGSALAGIGILQFAGTDVSAAFRLPFLTEHSEFQQALIRSDLRRVAGTSGHPIEFGVVLALVFPLALHYALHARTARLSAWVPVGLIALAIPMSVSRSGAVALAVTFGAMWVTWPNRLRLRSAVTAAILAVAMRFAVPGLLGTIRSLFTNLGSDDSVAGRTQDYKVVGRLFSEAPVVGRGYGTLLPDRYVLLDNQYLGSLVETGIIGVVLLVAFFAVGFATARGARRGADPETRSLSQALAGAVLAAMIAAGTFDLLGFAMAAGVTSLLIGCGGALWRLQAAARAGASTGPAQPMAAP